MLKKRGISEVSLYRTYPYNLNLINLSKYIENTILNYGIIVSNIYINEYRKIFIIHFTVFIPDSRQYKVLSKIIKYIKSLLILKFNKNIYFNIKTVESIYHDNKILSSWFKYQLLNNPQKFRLLMKQVIYSDIFKKQLKHKC